MQPAPPQQDVVTQVFLPKLGAAPSKYCGDFKLTDVELQSILIKRH